MYTAGRGAIGAAAATTTALILPNTGSNMIVTIAISVAVGLIAWGFLYSRAR